MPFTWSYRGYWSTHLRYDFRRYEGLSDERSQLGEVRGVALSSGRQGASGTRVEELSHGGQGQGAAEAM